MTLHSDHVAGGIAIAAALAVLAVSGDLPFGTLAFPGAGMLPKLVCGLMILFGAILMARGSASAPFSDIAWSDLPHAVQVLAITAAAIALYATLGFIVTMSLMLFALVVGERRHILAAGSVAQRKWSIDRHFAKDMSLMLFALVVSERRNLLAAAAYSLGVSLMTYWLFTVVLKSPLDQGIFGI